VSENYYKTLGVSEDASPEDIKRAFRNLAKKYHPDRNKDDAAAEARFKEISEAYDTLSNEGKRREYDQMLKYGAFTGQGTPGGGFNAQGFPGGFEQFFRQSGGGGRGGFQSFRMGGMDGMQGLEDILGAMFGGGDPFGQQRGGRRQRPGSTKGQNAEAGISISFWEAVHGTTRTLTMSPSGKKINVKIPKGIEDGGKIRLSGLGGPGQMGGQNGDLIITVRVMSDQQFERKGNDVYTSVKVPFQKAILGGKVEVKTLSKTVAVTVQPGTQPGSQMRLKGLGLEVGGKTGDVYVKMIVELPATVTDKQRQALEEWEE